MRCYHYLVTLWAVVTAASVRFHVEFVAGWVNAFLCETDHAFTDLLMKMRRLFYGASSAVLYIHLQPVRGSLWA